jgi:Raf kinase inhibitor-like YbhB/YbcL family protein
MHPVEILLVPLGRVFRNRRADVTASLANASQLATENRIVVASPGFDDGQVIPARYCGQLIGENVSPALTWSSLPSETVDLLLVIEDLDSPGASPTIHTIAAFAPAAGALPEAALSDPAPGIRFLQSRRGPGKYVGPRPLPGHGTHHYRFHLYALDHQIDLGSIADSDHLPSAAEGHVLASGTLTGTRTS